MHPLPPDLTASRSLSSISPPDSLSYPCSPLHFTSLHAVFTGSTSSLLLHDNHPPSHISAYFPCPPLTSFTSSHHLLPSHPLNGRHNYLITFSKQTLLLFLWVILYLVNSSIVSPITYQKGWLANSLRPTAIHVSFPYKLLSLSLHSHHELRKKM